MVVSLYPKPQSFKDKIEPYIPFLSILTIITLFLVGLGLMAVVENRPYHL